MKQLSLLAILCVSILCALPVQAQKSIVIPLEPAFDGLMVVHASIAGHPGRFLFDSGSGFSSISPAFAATVGCSPWGQITGFRMTGERLDMQRCDNLTFDLGTRKFPAATLGVFDISKYLPGEVGPLDGTIALDIFSTEAFTLSYGGRFLEILGRQALPSRIHGLHAVPVHLVRDAEGLALTVNLPVKTPRGTVWFEMDSGNTSPLVLVNNVLASLFGLATDTKQAPVDVTLVDGTAFHGQARTFNLILDGNLGISFLSTHNVTVDLPHATAWVSPFDAASKKNSQQASSSR